MQGRKLNHKPLVLDSRPYHWATVDVAREVAVAHAILATFRRKLGVEVKFSNDDLETLANIFRFNVLGSRGAFWHAGLRTFIPNEPSVLRQRIACLSVIVPLNQDAILHYGGLDETVKEHGTLHFGEAWLIESKPSTPIQQIVVDPKDTPVECLIVTFDSLDLASALANI